MTEKKNLAEKKKRGRKSEYRIEYADQALKLCLLGATDKELSEFFSVSEQTLNKWKKDYPEFLESLKKGKNIADANVASRLYNRAIGYNCKATKFATSNGKITDSKELKNLSPPPPPAAIFWLKNRQPEKWRDKKEVDANVNLGDELESLTDEQLQAIIDGKEKE